MEIKKLLDQFEGRKIRMMDHETYRWSGVLIPLVYMEDEIHLVFEVRSMQLRSQPGDICFPGGRMDASDADLMACAIRETSEELGIDQADIDHIIPLDFLVSGKGIIQPYAGRLKDYNSIVINQDEVAEVFTVPLTFFMNHEPKVYKISLAVEPDKDFPFELIQNGKEYDFRKREMEELFYDYDGRVIWGLTAKIIRHFVSLLK